MANDKKFRISIELIVGNELKYKLKAVSTYSDRLTFQASDTVKITEQRIKDLNQWFDTGKDYKISEICNDLVDKARTFYKHEAEIKIRLSK